MLKKAGMLTVGVTAGLLAVAPLANAGVSESDVKGDSDKGNHKSWDDDNDKDHGKKKHHGGDNRSCEFDAGDAKGDAASDVSGLVASGASAVNALGGSNTGNALNCSDILSDNINDNQVNLLTLESSNEK